ncbi:hypothetical protein Back2_10900 [Nocardioides baekrokdamisoli]|uniref:Uncharacterized protein n=1 Tax=Nocardioides baekrokdamisoli TaxID=1804624 RepID=A0A3G9IWS0_9ACTN|nr:hypothetical protein [Nocardioides baekrokdamisoli]BBH16803.1 hypothetical protein Back2_10900 [Nocardioides baekrokdamisoli]
MNPDLRVAIIGVGVAVATPAIAAIWRTATLRGDTLEKLGDRVEIAHSGLSELALERLRNVQEKTDQHLGEVDGSFSPEFVVADPGEIVSLTRDFESAIKIRDTLRDRFQALLFICKWAWVPAVIYLAGVVLITALCATDTHTRLWRTSAFTVVGVGVLLGAVVVICYHYLHGEITSAELLARPKGVRHD